MAREIAATVQKMLRTTYKKVEQIFVRAEFRFVGRQFYYEREKIFKLAAKLQPEKIFSEV